MSADVNGHRQASGRKDKRDRQREFGRRAGFLYAALEFANKPNVLERGENRNEHRTGNECGSQNHRKHSCLYR